MNHPEFENFRRCVDDAPDGTYHQAKSLASLLSETCSQFMADVRQLGLRADNCDGIYRIEAALYDYIKQSNPDAPVFPVSEGFGSAMGGPARDRVRSQAASSIATLRALGVTP